MYKYFLFFLLAQSAAVFCMENSETLTFLALPEEMQARVLSISWNQNIKCFAELRNLRLACKTWNRLLHDQNELIPMMHAVTPPDFGESNLIEWPAITPRLERFFGYMLSLDNPDVPLGRFKKSMYKWLVGFNKGQAASIPTIVFNELENLLFFYGVSLLRLDFTMVNEQDVTTLSEFISLGLSLESPLVRELCKELLYKLRQTAVKDEFVTQILKKQLFHKNEQLIKALLQEVLEEEKEEKLLPEHFEYALERAGAKMGRMPQEKELEDSLSFVLFSDDEKAFLEDVRKDDDQAVKKKLKQFSRPLLNIAFLCSLCWQQEKCTTLFLEDFELLPTLSDFIISSALERNIQFLEESVRRWPEPSKKAARDCKNLDAVHRVYRVTHGVVTSNSLILCHEGNLEILKQRFASANPDRDLVREMFCIFCATGNLEGIKLLLFDPLFAKDFVINPDIVSNVRFLRIGLLASFLLAAFSNKQYDLLDYLMDTFPF